MVVPKTSCLLLAYASLTRLYIICIVIKQGLETTDGKLAIHPYTVRELFGQS